MQGLPVHQKIVSEIGAAIGEDMQVRDTASEEVRRTRNKCRTLEGRLRAILKGASGEVSEQVDWHAAPSLVTHGQAGRECMQDAAFHRSSCACLARLSALSEGLH